MKVTILCSSETHPINPYLDRWAKERSDRNDISIVRFKAEATGGDLLLLISCSEIVNARDRSAYRKSLVVHASALPEGRGWSPHIWQILDGRTEIVVTLLEAADKVDSGDIWHQVICRIPEHALWDEINDAIFKAELSLMDFAIDHFLTVQPRPQDTTVPASYYPKRTPSDSELDPFRSIEDQFNKMRVADPRRFPAFFKMHGHTYKIRLEKEKDE